MDFWILCHVISTKDLGYFGFEQDVFLQTVQIHHKMTSKTDTEVHKIFEYKEFLSIKLKDYEESRINY